MNWLVLWLVVLVICIIIELLTLGVTAVWFGAGALAAALMAALKTPAWAQCLVFAVVSFLLFAFVRPSVKRNFDKKRRNEKLYDLVGQRGIVSSEIDNMRGIGLVKIGEREWRAKSREKGVVIPRWAIVDVIGVDRDKLVVCLDETMAGNIHLKDSEMTLDPRYFDDDNDTL